MEIQATVVVVGVFILLPMLLWLAGMELLKWWQVGVLLVFVLGGVYFLLPESSVATGPEERRSALVQSVHDIRLADGTRCVVYGQGNQGGIACDWESGRAQSAE